MRLVQGMYTNVQSRVRVGQGFSQEFGVKVWVHQGSVLSPLLFIIVLEALSREFWAGVPWEDLYADDHVIIADSLEECIRNRSHGEEGIGGKCRKDNGHDLWYRPGPLAEFRWIPMCCLSYRSRQHQHPLQWLQTGCIRNAAGYKDWHQILIIGIHDAWEMPVLLTADHRVNYRSA